MKYTFKVFITYIKYTLKVLNFYKGTYAENDICSLKASLNQDLLNINNWLTANKLTLNIMTKTEFMSIGSRQKMNSLSVLPDLEINGT